jgi:hypothetical protein
MAMNMNVRGVYMNMNKGSRRICMGMVPAIAQFVLGWAPASMQPIVLFPGILRQWKASQAQSSEPNCTVDAHRLLTCTDST